MKRLVWSLLLALCASLAFAQITASLDGSAHGMIDHASSASTSVSVTITPTAGDGITCELSVFADSSATVSDNVNAGNYSVATTWTNGASGMESGIFYKSGVAGSSTTITATFASSESSMSCEAWKPSSTPATFTLDSTAVLINNEQSAVANPTAGTAVTPAHSNELILGYLTTNETYPVTAYGTNYTGVDADTTGNGVAYPEYWIQTTATAANSPYTEAADVWVDQQAGFYFAGPTLTWASWNGMAVGSQKWALGSLNGKSIGNSTGNISSWNGMQAPISTANFALVNSFAEGYASGSRISTDAVAFAATNHIISIDLVGETNGAPSTSATCTDGTDTFNFPSISAYSSSGTAVAGNPASIGFSGSYINEAYLWVKNTVSGSVTVTCTWANSTGVTSFGFSGFGIQEYSCSPNCTSVTFRAGTSSAIGVATTTNPTTVPCITAANAGSLVIVDVFFNNGVPSGWYYPFTNATAEGAEGYIASSTTNSTCAAIVDSVTPDEFTDNEVVFY